MGIDLTCIDIFCGAGGLSEGLIQAGWQVVASVDNDENALKTYRTNHRDTICINHDLNSIPEEFRTLPNSITLVAGGPPCQPFSVAGRGLAAADSRDCIPAFIETVRSLKPLAFMMENVPGLASKRNQNYLDGVITSLRRLGYTIPEPQILNAADYGVPQFRRRLFVVGMIDQCFIYPEPTHGPGRLFPYVTSKEAIDSAPSDIPNRAIVTYAKKPVLRPSCFDGLLVNGQGRPIDFREPSQTIPATAGGNRTHIIDPDGTFESYHKRLMAGGEPFSGIVPGVRRLTVSESAAIQGFRLDYVFEGSQSSRYRQVGNAVPPGLAAAVARQLASQLNSEDLSIAASYTEIVDHKQLVAQP